MTKHRKRPVVIEAVRYTGDNGNDIWNWVQESAPGTLRCLDADRDFRGQPKILEIKTLDGTMIANVGDWIVKGVKGEFYPVKNDVFLATYEIVG